jgi:hypothetical protein
MNPFAVPRDATGMPARLVWSSEIQRRVEQQVREENARREAQRIAQSRPAPWIEEWMKTRPTNQSK